MALKQTLSFSRLNEVKYMARFAQVQTENAQYVAVHFSGVTLFFDLDLAIIALPQNSKHTITPK